MIPQGGEDMATLYKENAAAAAGINIKVTVIEPAKWFEQYYLKATFTTTTWGSSGLHTFYTQCCTPDAAYNETHMNDPEMFALVKQAGKEFDLEKRKETLWQLQTLFWERSGYVLPTTSDLLDATAANVEGITPTVVSNLGFFDFRSTWLS